MNDPNSIILPYILAALSQEPALCDSLDHLCESIEARLKKERIANQYGNVRNVVEHAVNIGESLGIVSVTEQIVRMPFNVCNKRKKTPFASLPGVWRANTQPEIGTGNILPSQRSNLRTSSAPNNNTGMIVNGGARGAGTGQPSNIIPMQPAPQPSAVSSAIAKRRLTLAKKARAKARAQALARRKAKIAKLKRAARSRSKTRRSRSRVRGRPSVSRKRSTPRRRRGKRSRR